MGLHLVQPVSVKTASLAATMIPIPQEVSAVEITVAGATIAEQYLLRGCLAGRTTQHIIRAETYPQLWVDLHRMSPYALMRQLTVNMAEGGATMIVKWMNLFGSYRVYSTDYNKASKIIESLEYEMRDCRNSSEKESSAEFFTKTSKTLAYAIQRLCAYDDDFVCLFYGLVIDRSNVVKKFDGDVDSGYSEHREVNTNPRTHDIRHCEAIYRKHNAVKGVLLVSPPKDYIHRQRVLSLQGIIKKYAIRHGLKIYEGGEEIIAASYD